LFQDFTLKRYQKRGEYDKIFTMEFSTIASGSSGNCIYIRGGDTRLLVDVGCSMRHIKASLEQFGTSIEAIDAILITHEHTDHVSRVAQLSRRFAIPVYASALTWENLPFYNDYFPADRHIFDYGMEIGDIALDFFRLSHDAAQPVGMIFEQGGQHIGLVTDTGIVTSAMYRQLTDMDGLIIEANHDSTLLRCGPYPAFLKKRVASELGHLSNAQTAEAVCRLVGPLTRQVVLAHLSETNNRPELALEEVRRAVDAACPEKTAISVAPRKAAHPLIILD
jgi:phosphoribosyl 1,2-cyclic phosphodiesterase